MEESSSSQSAETAETETIVITPAEFEKLGLKNELVKVIEEQTKSKSPPTSAASADNEHKTEESTTDAMDDSKEVADDTKEIAEEKADDDLEKITCETKHVEESPQNIDKEAVDSVTSENSTEQPDTDCEKIQSTDKNQPHSETTVEGGDKRSTDAKFVEKTYSAKTSSNTSAKTDISQEASIDTSSLQKRMKNKLCTLLNHTPLVMQVKNVDWITADRKSPILLNTGAKTVVQIDDDDDDDDDEDDDDDDKEDNESKLKFTIVSDEKSNLSPSEIEDMISNGKQIKSDEKLTPTQKDSKSKTAEDAQSTSKANADPGVKKKECLKRIQAKMYENLKKVLQEVDSFPVKDKASLHLVPVQTNALDEPKTYKKVPAAKPPEKVKENKPCYMSTYRERKRSQEDSEDSRTGKSVSDGEVIEIDSQPGSPVNIQKPVKVRIIGTTMTDVKGVINLDDDDDVAVKVPKKRGRPKRISNVTKSTDNDEDYTPEKGIRTGSPLKKVIAKRYSESEKTDSPEQQITPKRRGRPRKNFNTSPATVDTQKSNDSQNDLSPSPSNNDVESQESEPSSSKESPSKPEGPPRKRGRPPKNKNIIQEKTESNAEDEIKDSPSQPATLPESKAESEVKTPKKRGRKSKAEMEALRKKEAEQLVKIDTVEADKENYTQSKTSGRKRKIVNYSLLNGEDSDVDEPDVKMNRVASSDNRRSANKEAGKSSQDEYGSSNKNNKRIRTEDAEVEEQVPKSKQLKKNVDANEDDEADDTLQHSSEDISEQKTDDTNDNKNNNIKENHKVKSDPVESDKTHASDDRTCDTEDTEADQPDEKETSSEGADVTQCCICDMKMQRSLWAEHNRKVHNDLGWNSDEKPMNLEDTTVVQGILNSVLQEEGVLRCNNCEKKSDSVEYFAEHIKHCKVNLDLSKTVKRRGRRGKPAKDGGTADIINTLIINIKPESEGNDSLSLLESNELEADQTRCAVCMKVMLKSQWYVHKQSMHNNLAWRIGERPLDLNDKEFVIRTLKEYSKKKPLRCETCGHTRKSVVGYLSHRTQCARSQNEIEDMKVTCHLCQRKMLPVSFPTHMMLYHTNKVDTTSDNKTELQTLPDDTSDGTKRKAANKAAKLIQGFSTGLGQIKYVKGVRFRSKDEVISKFNEDIQKFGEVACVFQNCTYTASDAEDLFQHLENCSEKCSNGYTCNYCLTTFRQRKFVEQHINEIHSKFEDDDVIIQDVSTDEEKLDDDDEEDSTDGTIYTKSQITTASIMHANFLGPLRKKLVSSCYSNAFKWTLDYYQDNYAVENIFSDIATKLECWRKLDHSEIQPYIPKLKKSIDFDIKHVKNLVNPTASVYTWKNFKLFQSDIDINGDAIIFCGGPISSISWAPTPYNSMDADQILAVSTIPDPDKKYHCIYKYKDKNLIQFWNYGPLNNKTISTYRPKLEFCIAYDRGPIWCMEWCPSGCYDNDQANGVKKLGLLAIGGSDTDVHIYTILRPQQLSGKIFRVRPTFKLILDSPFDTDLGENSFHVTKISWSKVSGHAYLAVGFSNGVIGIYNVRNESALFRKVIDDVIVLKPILSFKAHTEAVTALVLSHLKDGKRWLISGSLDRDAKLWDLNDVSEPINSNKRYIITDAVWGMHWLAAIYVFNHSSLLGSVPSGLIPARNFNSAATTFLPSNSEVTSSTWSDWGNLFIQVNGSGEVICGFPDQLLYSFENDKRKSIRRSRAIASYTCCVSKKLTANERVQREQKKLLQLKGKINDADRTTFWEPRTYQEVSDAYGLVFCDFNMREKVKEPAQEMDKLVQNNPYHSVPKPDMYPMQSINKVVLNPNRNSFLYYACGYQVGLVRTSVLKFLN